MVKAESLDSKDNLLFKYDIVKAVKGVNHRVCGENQFKGLRPMLLRNLVKMIAKTIGHHLLLGVKRRRNRMGYMDKTK